MTKEPIHKKIINAVIVHGPGRSGTTLLSNILALHPEFYWISGYQNAFPNMFWPSLFNNFQRIPKLERYSRSKKKFPRPSEAYKFWRYYFKDFEKPMVRPSRMECDNTLKALNNIDAYTKGHRFLTKLTGMSRYNFLSELFENPTIIWIDRDPASVVMSYYKQRWFYKDKPAEFVEKSEIELISQYIQFYDQIQTDKEKLMEFDFIQVYYEDLVADPTTFFKDLCLKLDITWNDPFEKTIKSWEIREGTNDSYRQMISEESQKYLHDSIQDFRKTLGYNKLD